MSLGTYIGINTTVGETEHIETYIKEDNVNEYFAVTHSNEIQFEWYEEDEGLETITNGFQSYYGTEDSPTTITLTALMDIDYFEFEFTFQPNSNNILYVTINDSSETTVIIDKDNLSHFGIRDCSLLSGQSITFSHIGGDPSDPTNPVCFIYNIYISTDKYTPIESLDIAHRVSDIYIGIPTEFPIYESEIITTNITTDNILDFFSITNGNYYFVGNGSIFSSNNNGVDDSIATTTLTALTNMSEVSFDYSVSSETDWDKATITVADTIIANEISGTNSFSWKGSLNAGQTIEFVYSKDSI